MVTLPLSASVARSPNRSSSSLANTPCVFRPAITAWFSELFSHRLRSVTMAHSLMSGVKCQSRVNHVDGARHRVLTGIVVVDRAVVQDRGQTVQLTHFVLRSAVAVTHVADNLHQLHLEVELVLHDRGLGHPLAPQVDTRLFSRALQFSLVLQRILEHACQPVSRGSVRAREPHSRTTVISSPAARNSSLSASLAHSST